MPAVSFDIDSGGSRRAKSDQPGLVQRCGDKPGEQWMRIEWPAFQFGMELHAHEPWMIGPFDNFGEQVVG